MKINALFLLVPFLCLMGCGPPSPQPPELFLIPNGYVGWLQVFYGVKGAPPLPTKQGYRVYPFSRTGIIKTSSPFLYGWAKYKYCYTTPKGWKELDISVDGGQGMVWDGRFYDDSTVPDDDKHEKGFWPIMQHYFIGTWKKYQRSKEPSYYSKEQELEFARE